MLFKRDDNIRREDDSTVTHLLKLRGIPLQRTWARHMWSARGFSTHIKRQQGLLKPIKVSVLTLNLNKRKPLSEHRCRLKQRSLLLWLPMLRERLDTGSKCNLLMQCGTEEPLAQGTSSP